MEKVCPICNALTTITAKCPQCGWQLADGGALKNFFGPYSPYIDAASLPEDTDTQCVHLLYCPECGYDVRAAWELVDV
jgi:hypothetical protein